MRRITLLAVLAVAAATVIGCDSNGGGGGGGAMKTINDSASYAIGMNFGKGIKEGTSADSIDLDVDLIMAGIRDAMDGKETRLSDTVAQKVMMAFQQVVMEKQTARTERETTENQKEGDEFLAANKSKPGVKTTASGLQYIVKKEGSGESPDSTDIVSVEYTGKLIDGTEFDKSPAGQPVEFPVNGVIRGWTEALLLMKPGAEMTLFIPAALAYGPQGAPQGKIGPNETLIFEVKLLSVKDAPKADAGAPTGQPEIQVK